MKCDCCKKSISESEIYEQVDSVILEENKIHELFICKECSDIHFGLIKGKSLYIMGKEIKIVNKDANPMIIRK